MKSLKLATWIWRMISLRSRLDSSRPLILISSLAIYSALKNQSIRASKLLTIMIVYSNWLIQDSLKWKRVQILNCMKTSLMSSSRPKIPTTLSIVELKPSRRRNMIEVEEKVEREPSDRFFSCSLVGGQNIPTTKRKLLYKLLKSWRYPRSLLMSTIPSVKTHLSVDMILLAILIWRLAILSHLLEKWE